MMHRSRFICSVTLAACAVLMAGTAVNLALAQDRSSSPGLFDNLFNRGEPSQQRDEPRQGPNRGPPRGEPAQADPGDLSVRLDRMENALRQLTGTIEQLQYQNQQLQMQVQQLRGGAIPGATPNVPPGSATPNVAPAVPGALQPVRPGNRSDVFDPTLRPNAPGAPGTLGNAAVIAAPEPNMVQNRPPLTGDEPPIGAPGGRNAGAPLDLSTLAGDGQVARSDAGPVQGSQLGAPPAPLGATQQPASRNASAPGTQLATLPPTATPQDEYDMAYGYVLHKDYALAEQGFRDFLRKYPNERQVADAQYWLGESLFQRQKYRDAAEAFLVVSTKYDKAGKAPDSLLRLGQSLAALNQKEAACATLAEVDRKFPRASAGVKRGVEQEQKRAHC
jgi:tol-pal system protein YbgF